MSGMSINIGGGGGGMSIGTGAGRSCSSNSDRDDYCGGGSSYPTGGGRDQGADRGGTSSLSQSASRVDAEEKSVAINSFVICLTGAVLARNAFSGLICLVEAATDTAYRKHHIARNRVMIAEIDPILTRIYGNNDVVEIIHMTLKKHMPGVRAHYFESAKERIRTDVHAVIPGFYHNKKKFRSADRALMQTLAEFTSRLQHGSNVKTREVRRTSTEEYVELFTQ